jgi:hypothetical protein
MILTQGTYDEFYLRELEGAYMEQQKKLSILYKNVLEIMKVMPISSYESDCDLEADLSKQVVEPKPFVASVSRETYEMYRSINQWDETYAKDPKVALQTLTKALGCEFGMDPRHQVFTVRWYKELAIAVDPNAARKLLTHWDGEMCTVRDGAFYLRFSLENEAENVFRTEDEIRGAIRRFADQCPVALEHLRDMLSNSPLFKNKPITPVIQNILDEFTA